jgi:hypothetical protein
MPEVLLMSRDSLLITDDALAWATMRCEPEVAKRLNHILWPQPLVSGLWASGKGAVTQMARDVASWLGLATGQSSRAPKGPLPEAPNPAVQKELERIRQQSTRRPAEVNDPGAASRSAGVSSASPSSTPPDKTIGVSPGNQQAPGEKGWLRDMIMSIAKSRPLKTGQGTMARETDRVTLNLPQGAIILSGTVELASPKGSFLADVFAYYDPRTSRMFIVRVVGRSRITWYRDFKGQ